MPDLAILASYAHPDDEQGVTGTLRLCLDSGIRAAILCATRGEAGEIADPQLATPETLGEVRERELRQAAAVIGIHDVFFLGYRDSGMDGTPENKDPRAFVNADEHEAVGRIVKVIRDFRPTMIMTFDESGAYGHPDHVAIHHLTVKAFHAAGDPTRYPAAGPAFQPRRLFVSSIPRSVRRMMVNFYKQADVDSLFSRIPPEKFGLPDELITNRVNVAQYVSLKKRSLSAHRTQVNPNGPFAKVPPEISDRWRSVEAFALAAGDPPPLGADPGDLFAGLH
jgi:LmbE family N-acetylglucosaminyl deacetylase